MAIISQVAEKEDARIRQKDVEVRLRDTKDLMDCVRLPRSDKSSVGVGVCAVGLSI